MRDFALRAGIFESISGEAETAVCQDMDDTEGERLSGCCLESDRIGCILGIIDRQMDEA